MQILFSALSIFIIVLILFIFFDFSIENHFSVIKNDIPKKICPHIIRISVGLFIALFFSLCINVISFINITNMTKALSESSEKITELENKIEYSKQLIEYSKNN